MEKNRVSNRMPDVMSKMIVSRPASAAWRLRAKMSSLTPAHFDSAVGAAPVPASTRYGVGDGTGAIEVVDRRASVLPGVRLLLMLLAPGTTVDAPIRSSVTKAASRSG